MTRRRLDSYAAILRELEDLAAERHARAESLELGNLLARATQAERDLVRRILERGPAAVPALAVIRGGNPH